MTLPRVPLKPQIMMDLQARYPAAVATVINQRDVQRGLVSAPSSDPTHVFDTTTGLRLIVSKERLLDGRIKVHLSASLHNLRLERRSVIARMQLIVFTWQTLSGSTRVPVLVGVSEGGIPHFYVDDLDLPDTRQQQEAVMDTEAHEGGVEDDRPIDETTAAVSAPAGSDPGDPTPGDTEPADV